MKLFFKAVILMLPLLISKISQGQALEQMQLLYPDKHAVFSNVNRAVEINLNKGIPYAQATEISEIMILSDNANGMYSKDKVYHSSFNELKKVEAYTLVQEGSSTKKVKVTDFKTQSSRSQGVFYDDVQETSFDYPRLNKGNISHVQTEHYNKDVRFLSTFYFSNYLPVANASYSISFPDDVSVHYIIKNDPKNLVNVKETKKGKTKKLEFTAKDIKGNEFFEDGTSLQYSALHVIVYVGSYTSNGQTVPIFSSLNELYNWNVNFLSNVNLTTDKELKKITDSICLNVPTNREKAHTIFRWVQEHIKYVAFEAGLEGFIPRQAADVCAKRYGDCKDMASILTAMCKIAGLDAHFTWIGTRSIPYSYNEVPLPITDNHMICAVKIDNAWIFLDATDPSCIFGFPTTGIQGKEALISIDPKKYELVKVPVVAAEQNVITDSTFLSIGKNALLGNCSVDYIGYFGSDVYSNLSYHTGDDERTYARRRMAKGSNKFIMQDYKITLTDKEKRSANISSEFEIPGYTKSIADEIYINLNLEKLFNYTAVDTAKRKTAIENQFLFTINQVHTLQLPEDYATEYVPANSSFSNNLVDFSIVYKQEPGKISATQKFVLKKLYIEANDFALWNKTIAAVSPAYKEQIVLKKK